MLNARMFCRFDERVLWFTRGTWKWNQEAVVWGTVWNIARMQQQQGKVHPVEFPDEIPRRCILATTDVDDLVLDPFGGAFTTGVAAILTGRRFVGIEKERKYFDIAVKRIQKALVDAEKERQRQAVLARYDAGNTNGHAGIQASLFDL